jgi:hypothetical protein
MRSASSASTCSAGTSSRRRRNHIPISTRSWNWIGTCTTRTSGRTGSAFSSRSSRRATAFPNRRRWCAQKLTPCVSRARIVRVGRRGFVQFAARGSRAGSGICRGACAGILDHRDRASLHRGVSRAGRRFGGSVRVAVRRNSRAERRRSVCAAESVGRRGTCGILHGASMSDWVQHLLVFVTVVACVAVVASQTARTLFGRGGRIGQCCAKGCAGHLDSSTNVAKPQAAASQASSRGERVVFLPVEMLGRKR